MFFLCYIMIVLVVPAAQKTKGRSFIVDVGYGDFAVVHAQSAGLLADGDGGLPQVKTPEFLYIDRS